MGKYLDILNEELEHLEEAKNVPESVAKKNSEILLKTKKVPTFVVQRNSDRKEFAKIVRGLFKKLGIKKASVTTPNYSMATAIDIDVPVYYEETFNSDYSRTDDSAQRYRDLYQGLSKIMDEAFPTKRDRSDSMTDYFDFKFMLTITNVARD